MGFKPCYKWITFNTGSEIIKEADTLLVLNLVINGLPSILTITRTEDNKTVYY